MIAHLPNRKCRSGRNLSWILALLLTWHDCLAQEPVEFPLSKHAELREVIEEIPLTTILQDFKVTENGEVEFRNQRGELLHTKVDFLPANLPREVLFQMKLGGDLKNPVLEPYRLQVLAEWERYRSKMTDKFEEGERPEIVAMNALFGLIEEGDLTMPDAQRQELSVLSKQAFLNSGSKEEASLLAKLTLNLDLFSYGAGDEQLNLEELQLVQNIGNGTCAVFNGIQVAGEPPKAPVGSGVIIGKNLMLTCRHNYEKVGFKPEGSALSFGHLKSGDSFDGLVTKVVYDSEDYDFMVLEFGGDFDENILSISQAPILEGVELEPGIGLTTWGIPKGGLLSQSLNTQVVFPYEITYLDQKDRDIKIGNLAIDMTQSLLSDQGWEHFVKEVSRESTRDLIFTFFETSYQEIAGKEGVLFFHPDLAKPGQEAEAFPVLACNADTKPGDSGGAVLSLQHQSLVGILRGSRRELGNQSLPQGANLHFYEVVIPISFVVEILDEKISSWRNDYNVKFWK